MPAHGKGIWPMSAKLKHALFGLLYCAMLSSASATQVLQFTSGDTRVQLLELYTSQGCSSCPPAEAWLNKFTSDDKLWKRVIPLAFHVDYWDYLGWRDSLASEQYSIRQRSHRNDGNLRSVYTPGFVLNGKEWKGWFSRDPLPDSAVNTGVLSASLQQHRLMADYSEPAPGMRLNVAVLGFGIESEIAAGENAGRKLPQEFVVMAHEVHPSANGRWQVNLPAVNSPLTSKYGLAIWVSPADTLVPLQATGGWLPRENLQRLGSL